MKVEARGRGGESEQKVQGEAGGQEAKREQIEIFRNFN